MTKGYFTYVRVSTQRQGQNGTSLTEQTAAIDRYAKAWNLEITRRFEERETAAKTGRPVFLDMVKLLKQRKARGVIIHKIDRSARNLRDWAELGSLIDLDIEVHFANESLDLTSRGGRLSADIQAVVASDYIRNLREETIKGMRGRVKQGFYPLPAPLGYQDMGAARAKRLDPVRAPLLKTGFELYASGKFSLVTLAEELFERGLRNRNGGKLSKNALNVCLRNPFYIGFVKLRSMAESFIGQHKPLVSKALFEQVQAMLDGKSVKKKVRHFFVFRRKITCGKCRNFIVAERQKGLVYYRCHTRGCTQVPLKEETILSKFIDILTRIEFTSAEVRFFESAIERYCETEPMHAAERKKELILREQQTAARLEKLADAYMDGVFDRDTYATKKKSLLKERLEIAEKLTKTDGYTDEVASLMKEFLELVKSACLSFKSGNDEQRREFVEIVSLNIVVNDKNVEFTLNPPFDRAYDRTDGPTGAPLRDTFRTADYFVDYFKHNAIDFSTLKKPEKLGQVAPGFLMRAAQSS